MACCCGPCPCVLGISSIEIRVAHPSITIETDFFDGEVNAGPPLSEYRFSCTLDSFTALHTFPVVYTVAVSKCDLIGSVADNSTLKLCGNQNAWPDLSSPSTPPDSGTPVRNLSYSISHSIALSAASAGGVCEATLSAQPAIKPGSEVRVWSNGLGSQIVVFVNSIFPPASKISQAFAINSPADLVGKTISTPVFLDGLPRQRTVNALGRGFQAWKATGRLSPQANPEISYTIERVNLINPLP